MDQSEHRRSGGVAPVTRALAAVVAAALASACRDDATAPAKAPGAAVRTITTTLGTYSIPIPGTNVDGGAQPVAGTGIIVPAGTYYRIRVNGSVTATANPAWDCAGGAPTGGTYGPAGTGYYAELLVLLRARKTDGSGSNAVNFLHAAGDSARSDIRYASQSIEIEAGRNGISLVCNHNNGTGRIPGYLLSASQSVTVEQVTDVVHLVANPSYVHANQQVTFTASRDDGEGVSVQSWHWEPDPGKPGTPSNPCWWLNPCQFNPKGSGTMTVYTTTGSATAHVTVYSTFELVADNSTVADGDTVTFTAKYDGVPGPAARWQWIPTAPAPDSAACPHDTGPCKKEIQQSGTMTAFSSVAGESDSKQVTVVVPSLTLRAHFQSGPAGRMVVFTPHWKDGREVTTVTSWSWAADSVGGSTVACTGTPNVCETAVFEKGTMTVTATRGGATKTAEVHVSVVACATGDTLLDTDAIRIGLQTIDVMSRQGSAQNRHEQGIYFFENTETGEISGMLNFTNYSDHCSWADQPWPAPPDNSVPVVRGHSHPYDPAIDIIPTGVPCGKDKNGNPKIRQRPGRPHWGPSPADDSVAMDGGTSFVIDADSVYRTDGPGRRHSWPRMLNGCSLLPPVQLNRRPGKPALLPATTATNPSMKPLQRSARRTIR
jgi:hypothetical protein